MASLGSPSCQTMEAAVKTLAKTGSEVMSRGLRSGVFMVLPVYCYEVNKVWHMNGADKIMPSENGDAVFRRHWVLRIRK
ncbi:TPA: hypothetical protein ACKMVR_001977 [Neisseria gonorrhoeae]